MRYPPFHSQKSPPPSYLLTLLTPTQSVILSTPLWVVCVTHILTNIYRWWSFAHLLLPHASVVVYYSNPNCRFKYSGHKKNRRQLEIWGTCFYGLSYSIINCICSCINWLLNGIMQFSKTLATVRDCLMTNVKAKEIWCAMHISLHILWTSILHVHQGRALTRVGLTFWKMTPRQKSFAPLAWREMSSVQCKA